MEKSYDIFKTPITVVPGKTHCWLPIVDGRPLNYKGEPPFSLRAARKAVAKEIGKPVRDISFNIYR